jgi:hypothetical protein
MRDAFWATYPRGLAGYNIESAEDEFCPKLDNIAQLRKNRRLKPPCEVQEATESFSSATQREGRRPMSISRTSAAGTRRCIG